MKCEGHLDPQGEMIAARLITLEITTFKLHVIGSLAAVSVRVLQGTDALYKGSPA